MKPISYEITKAIPKTMNREVSKTIPKEISKELLKEVQKPVQKQTPKLMQKLIQKPISKQIKMTIPNVNPRQKNPTIKIPFLSGKNQPKQPRGSFLVSLRRFGKFKTIGVTRTQAQAFNIGKFKTRTTLGATFKVEGLGVKQPKNIFGYKTKRTKLGTLFIEKPTYRLSTPTEKSEINYFKRLKKGYRR